MFQGLTQSKSCLEGASWSTLFENTSLESRGFFVEKHHADQGRTILFCESSVGPIGGATLTKRNIEALHPKISQILGRLLNLQEIWECSNVFFMIPDDSSIHDNFEYFSALCHQFYRGLYNCLYNFAATQGTSHIISLNFLDEHQDISFFGHWPFAYEIEMKGLFPEDETEYVVGLLELSPSNYQRFCEAL